ncbi:hypothetical protein PsorP6_007260 [Peronosclerospora sorghi]|uniref:Uncharacterized protein n=1 Tax=Peronosclerospora sorghi TaxID=230839 RepID=A0ACC0WCC2_9STRA|nr:hypothetical protein PsorP6_007260 [Peronosclerospora sorghi]
MWSTRSAGYPSHCIAMSWLWGNETAEQAQFVVSALQGELDARESKIKALEAALKREQHDLTSLLEDEVKELEARRQAIAMELESLDKVINEKKALLQRSKSEPWKKTKKSKTPVISPTHATEGKGPFASTPVHSNANETAGAAQGKTKGQKKKKKRETEASVASSDAADSRAVLPMDKELKIVAKEEPNVAFIIQRSNNANTVVYAGCKSADGKALDATNPVKVYWIMYEKEGNPREDLNMIERNTAYGVTSKPSSVPGEYEVALTSLRDRDCILRMDKHGNVMALTTIGGKKRMLLRRVFVHVKTSWGLPTVDYVDIFGVDLETFEPVYEKKLNK